MTGHPLLVGVTVGDAAGVGPELVFSAWGQIRAFATPVVYANLELMRRVRSSLCNPAPALEPIAVSEPAHALHLNAEQMAVIDVPMRMSAELAPYPWGQAVPAFGALQYDCLVRATDDALANRLHAICTLPLHKKRLADAGLPATGHTEILAQRCGADVLMVLAGDRLRVALATTHLPLKDVATTLTADGILRSLHQLHDGLLSMGFVDAAAPPHIAVCGLNPHAGEEGILGDEEIRVVTPAILAARAAGLDVSGPWPADTLFPRVVHGEQHADAVLAMYHDQGLGPLKTAHHHRAANITFGLPIVRTSVDHGTAYDIAGRGAVRCDSFVYAFELATRLRRPQPKRRATGGQT